MARLPRLVVLLVALAAGSLAPGGPAGADTASGVAFLATTQQPNGGWDTSPASEFATTEVILAIAEQTQTGSSWSTAQALAAVDAFDFLGNPANPDPLAFADDMADGAVSPALAGKLIALVAGPLGIDPTDFDPKGDSAGSVNLVTAMDASGCAANSASFGLFGQTLIGMMAKHVTCGTAPPAAVAAVRAAQQADGGWNFTGTPAPEGFDDIDTTGAAIMALVAGGAGADDADVVEGLAFLASKQAADGTWGFSGSPSPESTSRAILAIAAAGYDPGVSCWRDTVAPALAGTPYTSPVTALAGLQNADGSWGSFGPDFATAQAIQGLERQWLPVARATAPSCATTGTTPGSTPGTTTAAVPATAVTGTLAFTG
jgi:Prenyltransferase and squalene oxidase repeat